MVAGRRNAALHARRLRARHTLELFKSRLRLPWPNHRTSQRRRLRSLYRQEHPQAPWHDEQLLRRCAIFSRAAMFPPAICAPARSSLRSPSISTPASPPPTADSKRRSPTWQNTCASSSEIPATRSTKLCLKRSSLEEAWTGVLPATEPGQAATAYTAGPHGAQPKMGLGFFIVEVRRTPLHLSRWRPGRILVRVADRSRRSLRIICVTAFSRVNTTRYRATDAPTLRRAATTCNLNTEPDQRQNRPALASDALRTHS